MNTSEIPDGWQHLKFGDIVCNPNITCKVPEARSRIVGLEHLDPGLLPIRRWSELAELPDGTSFTRVFRAGQVLFGKRRAYQRKVAVPDFDGICSSDLLVFEPAGTEVLPEFLPYVVQSEGFFEHALGTSAGSLSPRTKWQDIAKYELVLPPIDEQKRVIQVMRLADELVQTQDECLRATNLVADAVMASTACTKTLTLADVLEESPRNGLTISPTEAVTGVRSLTIGSVDEHGYRSSGLKSITNTTLGSCTACPGDLFITRSNTLERVGLPFRFPGDTGVVVFSDLLMRLRVKSDKLSPKILEAYLRSPGARRFIRSIAAGTSASMKKINGTNLQRLPIPEISLAEQRRIEDILDAQAELITTTRDLLESTRLVRAQLLADLLVGRYT